MQSFNYASAMRKILKKNNGSPTHAANAINAVMKVKFRKYPEIKRQAVNRIASGETQHVEWRVYEAMQAIVRGDELGVLNV